MKSVLKIEEEKLKDELNKIKEEDGLIGCILSSAEGLVIVEALGDMGYDSTLISAMAANMIMGDNLGYLMPNEMILIYEKEKIAIKRFEISNKNLDLIIILLMSSKKRYFRNSIRRALKIVRKAL
ncbi:MAG: hypothetical protein ACTSQO_12030 [Candidatus Helarchaeota archaeon]